MDKLNCYLNTKRNLQAILTTSILIVSFLCHIPLIADNLITSGTSVTVVVGTSMVAKDGFSVNSGGILNNSGTLILKKNLTNGNPLSNSIGNGTIVLSGNTHQIISGQSIVQNITINNSTGVTVGGNTQVNGILALSNGNVSIGAYNLLLGTLATLAGTPSSTGMIIATGSGELRKEFPTGFSGMFTFPVGDDTGSPAFSPVALSFTAGTFAPGNYVGVNLVNDKFPDANITGNYLNRYWKISRSGITGFNCDATFQYLPADVAGSEEMISCTRVTPLPWVTYALTNTSTHLLSASGIVSFGTFTGVKSTTPPAYQELTNITIPNGVTNCYDATQVLTVASNGSSFLVEDGANVTLVAGLKVLFLAGARINNGGYLHAYITTDGNYCGVTVNPLVANLIMDEGRPGIEKAAKYQFIKIYPNPTTDIVTVEFVHAGESNITNITVYSMNGGKLLQKTVEGDTKFQFSLAGMSMGIYMVHVQSGDRSEIAKVVKH